MRRFLTFIAMVLAVWSASMKAIRAYDVDCAIILCMAGGFPSTPVCSAAYSEMIRRITPWPILPPFGVCSFAVATGGSKQAFDISAPDYAWVRKARVYWFWGVRTTERGGDTTWTWTLQVCNHENAACRMLAQQKATHPWPSRFTSQNGLQISYPRGQGAGTGSVRGVLIEYHDRRGSVSRSEWYTY